MEQEEIKTPAIRPAKAARIAARLRDRSRPLPTASFEPTAKHRDRWAALLENAAEALQAAVDEPWAAGRELRRWGGVRRVAASRGLCYVAARSTLPSGPVRTVSS